MIRSRKHPHASLMALMTLALPTAVAQAAQSGEPVAHAAATNPPASPATATATATLPTVHVRAQRGPRGFKPTTARSTKLTQPVLDTPQTITVINRQLIQEQSATTLMQALQNTPGITLQQGENGFSSAGDTFQMRGFAAQSALLVDGIRDLGAVTRDTFNIDQVDVVKGDSGTDLGRSASSGYINLSSKQPTLRSHRQLGTVLASDGEQMQKRLTLDLNQRTGEHSAFRLNLMGQDSPVLGRDQARNRGFGIAPAFAWGMGTPLRTALYGQYIEQDNMPDGGLPTIGHQGFVFVPTATNPTAADQAAALLVNQAPKVNRHNYYGARGDHEDIKAGMVTAKVEYDVSDRLTVRNVLRYGESDMQRVMTGVHLLDVPTATVNDPATWRIRQLRQGTDQANRILTNQTSLTAKLLTGTVAHDVVAGVELLRESQLTHTLAVPNGTPNLFANLYRPALTVLTAPVRNGAYTDGQTDTVGVYAFDTLKPTNRIELTGGVRADRYQTRTTGQAATTTNNITTLSPIDLEQQDTLLSWKTGLVFKPVPAGSLYASYGTSANPPGGANFTLSSTASSTSNPNMEPTRIKSAETGVKWEVLDRKLLLTLAGYRTEVENELTLQDPVTLAYSQLGKRRIQGVEVSAVGKLTPRWDVNFGLATLDTKITEGTTGNNSSGAATRWSPDLTATLWTSHALTPHWKIGGGARYVSEQKRVVDPTLNPSTQTMPAIPAYWVADALLQYSINRDTSVRLNINNLADKEYIQTLNNSGNRLMLGAPRTFMLSGEYRF